MAEEQVLLRSLKQGDQQAFDVLFKKYAPRLYFFVFRFFNNRPAAEEIVQDTFVKIWDTRDRINVDQHFSTYLFTIAKHLIYNRFRYELVERKYREFILQHSGDSYSIEHDIVAKQLKEYLLDGIGRLPAQQKEILLLRNQGYDNDEIAQQLQLSKRTVETHINKAFKYLRLFLKEGSGDFIALTICLLYLF